MRAAFLLLTLCCACPALAATTERTLGNGLKVIVHEDHRAPVAVVQVWYKVGGSYEAGGRTGLSHFLEHMMFKGTARLAANEFSQRIAAVGGQENAFTGDDYTAYFETLPVEHLPLALELEAERMHALRLDPAELAKELEVVKEERRLRTEDDPNSRLYEQFLATAFLAHPYRNPVIGWMADLDTMMLPDVQDWYHAWYRPGNATLVVVGDVRPDAVFALAEQHFGPLADTAGAVVKPQAEPGQSGERRLEVQAPAQVPYLLMGYHAPVVAAADADIEPYALDVLAGVLAGGESARLPSRLKRGRELATDVSASYQSFKRAAGLFTLEGVPTAASTPEVLERALREEVEALRATPIDAAELARVKAQVVAAEVYQRDSMFYQGLRIGLLETIGLSWHLADRYVQRIDAVTAQDVLAVARKYLRADNLTVGILRPQAGVPAPRQAPAAGARHGVEG